MVHHLLDAATLHGRHADVIVLGQDDPDDPAAFVARHFVEDVVMGVGRPVLLVPRAGDIRTIGENVVIAWDDSREAARAVADDALLQQFLLRLGNSRWYGGVRYVFFDSTSSFTGGNVPDSVSKFERNQRIGAGSLILDYDSRDNIFYPGSGSFAEFEAQFARIGFGGTQNYDVYAARGFKWFPLMHALILGLRVETKFSTGDIPFYAQPYVDLRGVQKGRYQDRNAISTEVELRWDVTPRWSLLGFTGLGKAYGRLESFSQAQNVTSVGAGFRYLIARKLGVSIGIDDAHSKDQNAFYIQVGSAWR